MDVNRSTMTMQVYNILKKRIVSGEYESRQKLTEQGIAKELSVSPTPVREAFKKLSSEGFIESIPYRGVFLKEYSVKDIREAYMVRAKLEGLIVQLLIERLDESMKKVLIETYEDLAASDEENVFLKYYPLYEKIYLLADSEVIVNSVLSLNAILNIDILSRLEIKEDSQELIHKTSQLLDYILSGQTDKAMVYAENRVFEIMDKVIDEYKK